MAFSMTKWDEGIGPFFSLNLRIGMTNYDPTVIVVQAWNRPNFVDIALYCNSIHGLRRDYFIRLNSRGDCK
ncbi:hypothetical protein YH66_07135 [[Brevibacterium] flavum]|uniref:Uncharacterized protein n=2 Tax=Corynebacterium TaxID=1716 RepID=A0A0F6WQF1_9CORY|nr:hypothetical protein C629_07540 [Corynebacterium glutamicum SCgG2]AIK85024.1 hypothetical protein CGLAR1_07105 [Corynebacterium glutamicum]AKF27338.1 hypothetical protein YH66_07135 [[Brevibacterium] flavum]ANR62428.1 hypothetical protein C628_07385 [[Brevibacterium] flavum ZL-1]ANR65430.1 hypothetical protein C627_07315 [Corynebacterium glutamicum ZL-6]EGV39144.1 hypothetical protein CgS9114_14732 [Corynebacterium glutamicum S9114]EOA63813.1 hypothetical protein J433_12387 [Corynebacteriu